MFSKELRDIIENILPKESAIKGDKIGLQIQADYQPFKRILIAYEITDDVINEAVDLNCGCIITFHPLIYSPLQTITEEDRVGYLTTRLIKHSISVISVHTTFDTFKEGTSKIIADRLGLEFVDFLIPFDKFQDKGMGVIAKPKNTLTPVNLLESVYSICKSPIKYSKYFYKKNIETIAIIGGSGSSFLNEVIENKIDAFITADITYHKFHEAFGKVFLIDPGHYEMEKFVPEAIKNLFYSNGINELVEIFVSNVSTNPINYFPYYEIDLSNF